LKLISPKARRVLICFHLLFLFLSVTIDRET